MAVNVDTVYQRVLALANKEQRGYITPLEFNLLANQAQMEIFEQYFYDHSQFEKAAGGKNNTEYSNMVSLLNEKINIFEVGPQDFPPVGNLVENLFLVPEILYRLGTVNVRHDPNFVSTVQAPSGFVVPTWTPADEISEQEFRNYALSKLSLISLQSPVYIRRSLQTGINAVTNLPIFQSVLFVPGANVVECTYIRRPSRVEWGYDVVGPTGAKKALYNATKAINFELHNAEQTNLVIKILELSGIILQDVGVIQVANSEEMSKVQQQKL